MDASRFDAERMKAEREKVGWSQDALATRSGLSRGTIINYETGKRVPRIDDASKIASALGISLDVLMTEQGSQTNRRAEILKGKEVKESIWVPVLHPAATVCAGEGFRLEDVLIEATGMQEVPLDEMTGRLGDMSPFLVKVEGDSMTGIPDGAEMFCNPNEEIRTGDYAVCCVDGKWMVRGIIWRRDGSIELRPTNGEYHPIIVAREDLNTGWAKILAKVMWVRQGLPKFI